MHDEGHCIHFNHISFCMKKRLFSLNQTLQIYKHINIRGQSSPIRVKSKVCENFKFPRKRISERNVSSKKR